MMWSRKASGAGTHELIGRWSTSSVVNALSVVYSRIFFVYSALSVTLQAPCFCGAAKEKELKKNKQRTAIASRFMMVGSPGNFGPRLCRMNGGNVEPGRQYNYSAT